MQVPQAKNRQFSYFSILGKSVRLSLVDEVHNSIQKELGSCEEEANLGGNTRRLEAEGAPQANWNVC